MADTEWWAEIDLPATVHSPGAARRLVEELLLAWGRPYLDDAVEVARLVVSELVTNSVRHASDGGVLHLLLRADQSGGVYLAISDGSAVAPAMRDLTSDSEGGRGLHIVDKLAARWGVTTDTAGGKSIWVQLS
ncbi:ATP-binding protein [Actinopolymorpha sp. B11F2]|uniref:ATP-binding protein n=1 Tax=Actinopolymorpha sp. B11F2 TaxID=3160862 RepID=UPI0032E50610